MEITTTHSNLMVYPRLAVWGWDIAYYLLLSGMAAGILVIASVFRLYYGDRLMTPTLRWAALAAPLVVPVGMLGLLHNVENKLNIPAFYLYFNWVSPKAWGAWGLLLVPPVGLLFALALLPPELRKLHPLLEGLASALARYEVALARLTVAGGLFLGTYTGVLLSTNVGRPLWNTPLLPPLFLVSGLSTAAAALALASRDHGEKRLLTRIDVGLIGVEMALLGILLVGFLFSTESARSALLLLVSGPYAAAFWVLVFGIGLLIPLALEQLQLAGRIPETALPAVMVLAGGLALRAVMVFAGQASHIGG